MTQLKQHQHPRDAFLIHHFTPLHALPNATYNAPVLPNSPIFLPARFSRFRISFRL